MSKKNKKEKLRWFKISGIIKEARTIRWPKPLEVAQKTGIVLAFTISFALFFSLVNVALIPLTRLFMR